MEETLNLNNKGLKIINHLFNNIDTLVLYPFRHLLFKEESFQDKMKNKTFKDKVEIGKLILGTTLVIGFAIACGWLVTNGCSYYAFAVADSFTSYISTLSMPSSIKEWIISTFAPAISSVVNGVIKIGTKIVVGLINIFSGYCIYKNFKRKQEIKKAAVEYNKKYKVYIDGEEKDIVISNNRKNNIQAKTILPIIAMLFSLSVLIL